MQSLIKYAVTRKVTMLMFISAILLLGAVSWSRTPVDLFPDIAFPGVAVVVSYPGAAPQEVEQQVTRVLESVLWVITNVREVQSVSGEASSTIIARFNWGTNMDLAAQEIRERLDQAAQLLPSEASRPAIYKFDPSVLPVMSIAVASDALDMVELTRLGEEAARRLERLDGVASVNLGGGIKQEIEVTVDRKKLEENGILLSSVTNALRAAGVNIPGGRVPDGTTQRMIRTIARLQAPEAMESLPVGMRVAAVPGMPGPVPSPLLLGEVAEVKVQNQKQDTVARLNGADSLSLEIYKRADANTVLTAYRIKDELEKLAGEYPDVLFIPTDDQSQFIEWSIATLVDNALLGGALAVLILLAFLRDIRSTVLIALSIPISLVSTFILMFFSGVTVNLMTLSGLALGVGMLVDNSIVVIENIFRHLQSGKSGQEAALDGTREVATAIAASTLTTMAVFLPVVFVGGFTGILFRELALTVSFSLFASLLVALTVIPVFSALLLKPERGDAVLKNFSPASIYRRSLAKALRHRRPLLLSVAVLFALSMLAVPRLGGDFLPALDEGTGMVMIEMHPEASPADTVKAAEKVEALLLGEPHVEYVRTSIGSASRWMAWPAGGGTSTASVSFRLKPQEERGISTGRFTGDLAARLPALPNASFSITQTNMAFGGILGGRSVEIELSGPEPEVLEQLALRLERLLSRLDYVESTSSSLAARNPELQVKLDLPGAMSLGINPVAAGSAIRSAFLGESVGSLAVDGVELPIVVRLREEQRSSIEDVENVRIANLEGMITSVREVATLEKAEGPFSISRRNNRRTVTVSADLKEGMDLLGARNDIQGMIDELELPAGYAAEFRGQVLEMQDAFSGMFLALSLAVALVYMVMASQFESLVHPLTIMFTMPLAAIGVILMLLATGQTLNISSLIGMVVLAGVVVNNAIVMVDCVNQLRGSGMEPEAAVLAAAETRLRPILMTTLTTVLGLIPLAVGGGSGSEMYRPLALTLLGGLIVGAFLTLYVIPIVYLVMDRLFPGATNIVKTRPRR